MRYDELEIAISAQKVEIWHQGRCMASMGVTEDGFVLASNNTVRTGLPYLQLGKIDVSILVKEEEPAVGLPRYTKKKAKTEVIKAPRAAKRAGATVAVDNIDAFKRDQVLNAILDSIIDRPDQKPAFRASETKRIAAEFSEPLFAVAGVRAALTRGTYGDPDEVLSKRKRQRARLARAAVKK